MASSSTSAFCEEYLGELAELIVSGCDAGSLSEVPNSAKLQQILAQIKRKPGVHGQRSSASVVQEGDVSSSQPTFLASHIAPMLLEALDGFFFVMNSEGYVEFVSENVRKYLRFSQSEILNRKIFEFLANDEDRSQFFKLLPSDTVEWQLGLNAPHSSTERRSHAFMCKFIVKPTGNEMPMGSPLILSLHVSTISLPYPCEHHRDDEIISFSSFDASNKDSQACLVCVARRLPEKTSPVFASPNSIPASSKQSSSVVYAAPQQQRSQYMSSVSGSNSSPDPPSHFCFTCNAGLHPEILAVDLRDHIAHSLIPAKEVFLRSPLLKFSRPGDDILSWECHLRKAIDSGMNISELRLLLPPRCEQTLVLRVKTRLVQLPNQPERLVIDFWILNVANTEQLNSSASPSSSKSSGANNSANSGMMNDISMNNDVSLNGSSLNGSSLNGSAEKAANLHLSASASMFDNSGHWSDFTSGPNSLDFLDDFDMDPNSFEDSFAGSGASHGASLSINCPVYTNVSPPNSNNSFAQPMAKAPMQSPQTVSSTDHLHPPPDYHSMMWEYSGARNGPPLTPNQGMLKELLNQDDPPPISSSVYAGGVASKSVSPVKVKTEVQPTPSSGGGTKAKRQPKKPKISEHLLQTEEPQSTTGASLLPSLLNEEEPLATIPACRTTGKSRVTSEADTTAASTPNSDLFSIPSPAMIPNKRKASMCADSTEAMSKGMAGIPGSTNMRLAQSGSSAAASNSLLVQLLAQTPATTPTLPTSIATSPFDKLAKENKENPNHPKVMTNLVEPLLNRNSSRNGAQGAGQNVPTATAPGGARMSYYGPVPGNQQQPQTFFEHPAQMYVQQQQPMMQGRFPVPPQQQQFVSVTPYQPIPPGMYAGAGSSEIMPQYSNLPPPPSYPTTMGGMPRFTGPNYDPESLSTSTSHASSTIINPATTSLASTTSTTSKTTTATVTPKKRPSKSKSSKARSQNNSATVVPPNLNPTGNVSNGKEQYHAPQQSTVPNSMFQSQPVAPNGFMHPQCPPGMQATGPVAAASNAMFNPMQQQPRDIYGGHPMPNSPYVQCHQPPFGIPAEVVMRMPVGRGFTPQNTSVQMQQQQQQPAMRGPVPNQMMPDSPYNMMNHQQQQQQQHGMGQQIRGQMMDYDSAAAPPNVFIPQYPGQFVRASSNRMPVHMQHLSAGAHQQQQTQVPLESIQLDGLFSVAQLDMEEMLQLLN